MTDRDRLAAHLRSTFPHLLRQSDADEVAQNIVAFASSLTLPPEPERLDDATFTEIADVIRRRCPIDAASDVADYLAARGLYDAAAGELAALPASVAEQARLVDAIAADVGDDAWKRSGLARVDGSLVFPAHRLVAFWHGDDGATVQTIQRRAGDVFLLCSDGLTEEVDDRDIGAVLARQDLSAQECVDHLILAALEGGGSDNVTVILIRDR